MSIFDKWDRAHRERLSELNRACTEAIRGVKAGTHTQADYVAAVDKRRRYLDGERSHLTQEAGL